MLILHGFDPAPLAVENPESAAVRVYPNPANDNFSISLPGNPDLLRLQMYNALGQLVLTQQFQNHDEINVSSLAKGLYYMTISGNRVEYNAQKILIE